jgi:hypothetical protein
VGSSLLLQYYHDNKSGRIFRSKNEVLQFLVDGRVGGVQMMSNGSSMKALSQNKNRPPVPIAPAKQTGFHSPLSKSSVSTQTGLIPQAAPSSPFTHMHPARMKTTPMRPTSAVSSERNETGMTWAHITGPNGSIWIPWDGAIGTGNCERYQGDTPGKDAGATGLHGGAANSSQLLSSGDGIQLPTGSPVSTVKPPSEQGDKENRGKLIFRLKRKQPDSGACFAPINRDHVQFSLSISFFGHSPRVFSFIDFYFYFYFWISCSWISYLHMLNVVCRGRQRQIKTTDV